MKLIDKLMLFIETHFKCNPELCLLIGTLVLFIVIGITIGLVVE